MSLKVEVLHLGDEITEISTTPETFMQNSIWNIKKNADFTTGLRLVYF
jgi:hypothetical protein